MGENPLWGKPQMRRLGGGCATFAPWGRAIRLCGVLYVVTKSIAEDSPEHMVVDGVECDDGPYSSRRGRARE